MSLYFWRTHAGHEVDFIIDSEMAIEIKSTDKVQNKHLKGLKFLMEEKKIKSYYLISQDPLAMQQDGIT